METKIGDEISNIEAKIRATRGRFKGRATREQRKAEAELRKSLDELRRTRDKIRANVREAPARMQEEYDKRLAALNRPVREAEDILRRRQESLPAAPHNQKLSDAADAYVNARTKTVDNVSVEEAQAKVAAAKDQMKAALALPPEGAVRMSTQRAEAIVKAANPKITRLQAQVQMIKEKLNAARQVIETHRAKQIDNPLVPRGEKEVVPPEVVKARADVAEARRWLKERRPIAINSQHKVAKTERGVSVYRVSDDVDWYEIRKEGGNRWSVHVNDGAAEADTFKSLGEAEAAINSGAYRRQSADAVDDAAQQELRAKLVAAEKIVDDYRAARNVAERKGRSGKLPAAVVKAQGEFAEQQRLLREATAELDPLLEQVRIADNALNPVRQPNARLTAKAQKMMADAEADIARYGPIAEQKLGTSSPLLDAQAELARIDELIPNTPPSRLERLQRKRARVAARMAPGGDLHAEVRARAIQKRMKDYNDNVIAKTANEQAALDRAIAERGRRQEAIIWANTNKTARHITRPHQPASDLEQMGWLRRGGRTAESIQGGEGFPPDQRIPQPEAWSQTERGSISDVVGGQVSPGGETVLAPSEVARPRPVPTPRTEVEALESLQSQLKYGSPAQQALRIPLQQAEQNLIDAATRAPHEIAAEKARIAAEVGKEADAAVGGDVLKTETYANLASDLADKRQLVAKRDELIDVRDDLNNVNPTYLKADLSKTIDDLESIARVNPLVDDVKLAQTESVLQTHRQELQRIGTTKMRISDLDRVVADANSGKLGNVMIAALDDNWRAMHSGPLNTGDVLMDAELHKRFTNLFELNKQPRALGRVFNAYTNLFKTYATLSPGFFVRNTIGGVFMNTADGVPLRTQAQGAQLWRQFMRSEEGWLETQPQKVQDAFAAAFASGAGGRFEDAGVLHRTNSAFYNRLSSNKATRAAQRAGTAVEGSMRLGMALDSIERGESVSQALGRISRVHFDYAQISEIDDTMKRIIPFWTFMSRNLPLQIQEQWTNPRVYSYYDHLVSNFSLPDDEFTPDYWKRQGAWKTPLSVGGMPIYAQPDLGFTRVQSDIKMLGDTLSGENAGALAAQSNPLIGATMDFFNRRDSFYNRNYEDTDFKELSGPLGSVLSLVAGPLGQTNEAGQVDENFINLISGLMPPVNQTLRLLPGAYGDESKAGADTAAKWARYWGAPAQLLTPSFEESEYWRQWREMQDEFNRQRTMAQPTTS